MAGWLEKLELRLNSASVEVEVELSWVEAELGNINFCWSSTLSATPRARATCSTLFSSATARCPFRHTKLTMQCDETYLKHVKKNRFIGDTYYPTIRHPTADSWYSRVISTSDRFFIDTDNVHISRQNWEKNPTVLKYWRSSCAELV